MPPTATCEQKVHCLYHAADLWPSSHSTHPAAPSLLMPADLRIQACEAATRSIPNISVIPRVEGQPRGKLSSFFGFFSIISSFLWALQAVTLEQEARARLQRASAKSSAKACKASFFAAPTCCKPRVATTKQASSCWNAKTPLLPNKCAGIENRYPLAPL